MRQRLRISIGTLVVTMAWSVALACGRSEQVGWRGREMPDSVAERGAARQSAPQQSPAGAEAQVSATEQEYQRLARSLAEVQRQAISGPELSAGWNALLSDVDGAILARSAFHRGLMDRRDEIERLMEQPDTLTREQQAELGRNYRNIQLEMARARNQEFRTPRFADRFMEFQRSVFAKMRELAPDRADEIDRFQELESQLFVPVDSAPPVPGMRPIR